MNGVQQQTPAGVGPNGSRALSNTPGANMVEEGAAFMHLTGGTVSETRPTRATDGPRLQSTDLADGSPTPAERIEVVVIGAGQSGLSVGYHLARLGIRFVILEAGARIGDAWRSRWDSLRLFTPARFDGLDGLPFPQSWNAFPTKDEMGDYLEAYAAHFSLPVRTGTRVDRIEKHADGYRVTAGASTFEAGSVVVAMSSYQDPWTPPFASQLDPSIVQLHSFAYRSPSQLRDGGVLIVGAGNSGAEIAIELARKGHEVWLAGRSTGHVPFRIENRFVQAVVLPFLFRVIFHRLMTVDTPIGRRARPNFIRAGAPLIRVKPRDLEAAGVMRAPRVAGVRDGKPVLDDGRVLNIANVIWSTGFRNDFSWIERPVFDDHGEPNQVRGLAHDEPGLYFVGLHFLYSMSSTMIQGVGRDARRVAEQIAARKKAAR